MFRRPTLRKRLEALEARLGPPDPDELAFSRISVKFLQIITDDPLYSALIEPEFRRAQILLYAQRGVTLRDLAIAAGAAVVELDTSVTATIPEGAAYDRLWLCLDPAAAPIRETLDQTASYLDWAWEKASAG